MQSEHLLSQVALAKRWKKAPRKIAAWTKAGLLPIFLDPDSGRVLYPLAAIERWEAEHLPSAPPPKPKREKAA